MTRYTTEHTILTPTDTRISVEGWLQDTTYLLDTDKDDVYSFSFQPLTSTDHQRLFEAIERAVMIIEMNKDPYSKKVAKACCEDKYGLPYCSQLFKPKLNVDVEHPDLLYGKQVSLNLHFRDDPMGNVYLQGDYVDVYEGWNETPTPPSGELSPPTTTADDDW
jgi:hypothetical protein